MLLLVYAEHEKNEPREKKVERSQFTFIHDAREKENDFSTSNIFTWSTYQMAVEVRYSYKLCDTSFLHLLARILHRTMTVEIKSFNPEIIP